MVAGSKKTREAILRAASELFAEHGFDGAGMREIAAHANVALGTAYKYFRSKDEILFTLFGRLNTDLSNFIKKKFAKDADLHTQIRQFCSLTLDFLHSDRRHAYLIVMVFPFRELAQSPAYREAEYAEMLRLLLETGQKSGIVRNDVDALLMVNMVVGFVIRLVTLWLETDGKWDFIKYSDAILHLMMSAIETKPAQVAPMNCPFQDYEQEILSLVRDKSKQLK